MSFLKALRFFAREALVGLTRSWRVSTLAVLTIAVSLFLAGAFLLVSQNLSRAIADWRAEARLAVYLDAKSTEAEQVEIERILRQAPWVTAVEFVSVTESAARFRHAFPSLAELVDDDRFGTLPSSFEAALRSIRADEESAFAAWSARLAAVPAVELVDDDRDWIRDVEALLTLVRGVGSLLTAVLLGASVFTIAAVVRLTSFLYREEIAIMRLVGATEFFIRGPFYLEGLLQGLFGSGAALGALALCHLGLASAVDSSLVMTVATRDFLRAPEIGALILFGAAAGLSGALVSLGRERPSSESD